MVWGREGWRDALSIYLSMGQLLVLPFVIVLIIRGRYPVAAATLAVTPAVHFVPYSWLYATPVYAVMAAGVAVGAAVLTATPSRARRTVRQISALTT